MEPKGEEVEPKAPQPERRNQVLRNKFFAMTDHLKTQAPRIVDLLENGDHSKSLRATQSEVINNCFTKSAVSKSWVLDLNNPFFKETKARWVLPTSKPLAICL